MGLFVEGSRRARKLWTPVTVMNGGDGRQYSGILRREGRYYILIVQRIGRRDSCYHW